MVKGVAASSDGQWVEVKVERTETKTVVRKITGGEKEGTESIRAGFRIVVKGQHDADHKILSNTLRESMRDALGSSPLIMPFSFATGLIIGTWEGESSISEKSLLEAISTAISKTRVKNESSRIASNDTNEDRTEFPPAHQDNSTGDVSGEWGRGSLLAAKETIRRYHHCNECDANGFLADASFELYVQRNMPGAYAHITLMQGSRYFRVGVHPILTDDAPHKQRALVVVFVHELLHALHPNWGHNRINPEERLLANKTGYFDALVELQRIAVSGNMRFC